jgi:hypothetical protein
MARLKNKATIPGTEFTVQQGLTMGHNRDSMRLILNLTPDSKGNLKRRPSIRATDIAFGGTDWVAGNVSGTGDSGGHQIGDYDGTNVTGYTFEGVNYPTSRTKVTSLPTRRILEGIDCEIVHGRLVCVYLLKKASTTDIQLVWSWHWPTDLQLGYSSTQFAPAETASDAGELENAEYPGLHPYVAAKYWDRRIVNLRDYFVICGYGVGGNRVAGMAASKTVDNDSIPIMESQQLMMDCVPNDLTYMGGTSIVHSDGSGAAYVAHGPKECFAHYDKHAQTVWYGFHNTPFTYDGIASNEHLIPVLSDIDASSVVLRPFVVQYSEPMRPASMHALGAAALTGTNTGLNDEVVGMAEFGEGTVMFTHSGIYYVSGLPGFGGQGKMEILESTIGSDSRHSIKAAGSKVAFASNSGLFFYTVESGAVRVVGFDELFGDGITIDKGPYSYYQGDADNTSGGQTEIGNLETHECTPWGFYKIDTSRLDRAVGCVWDDLYILFCSLTTHGSGDDNRFGLVVNHRTGATSTWLLPKNMGVRGFAYAGEAESDPYVMTRYGVATLSDTMAPDSVWDTTGSGVNIVTEIHSEEPYPCAFMQSQWIPVIGESTSIPAVNIIHEMPTDDSIDTDMNMRIQAWSQVADLNAGQYTIGTSQFMTSDVGTLDDLYKGNMKSWYKESTTSGGEFAYYAAANGDQATDQEGTLDGTRYIAGAPMRSTTIRCHANAIAHRFQFHTLNQITVHNIDFQTKALSKRGTRG